MFVFFLKLCVSVKPDRKNKEAPNDAENKRGAGTSWIFNADLTVIKNHIRGEYLQ